MTTLDEPEGTLQDAARRVQTWVDNLEGMASLSLEADDLRRLAEYALQEPEWEYGTRWTTRTFGDEEPVTRVSRWFEDREMAEWSANMFRGMPLHYASAEVVRRRKAGPWEEVK